MELSKAKQIVQDMVVFHFYSEGVNESISKEVFERLEKYSLQEMITASKIIDENNGEKYIDENGEERTRMQMNVADRLIAAMYCLLNYESDSSEDCSAIINNRKKALYIVH